jgi:predicted metalloprotease
MTFNEGMQIDTSTTSSSGGPGRVMAIGGGVGGLVIVVVALLLGVDPGTLGIGSAPPAGQQQDVAGFDVSQCKTAEDANNILGCRIIATGNSVDAVWTQLLGQKYTRPHIRLFQGQVNTACGGATTEVGPFYCPADQTAYFDTDFFQELVKLGSSSGHLAQEYVVAHEFGHHVQNLVGDIGRAQQGAQGSLGNGVRTELQADCYAGIWAHYASTVKQKSTGVPYLNPLTDKDIQDALSAASSVGDDSIQKQSGTGRVNPESWTHGSSEQRQHWFTVGYQTGDPKRCDTYDAADLNNG